VVLYECLTGKRPFRGEPPTDTIGAVLHKEPDWGALPPNTPPTIRLLPRKPRCWLRSIIPTSRGIHGLEKAKDLHAFRLE
jgi:hypothetical protein